MQELVYEIHLRGKKKGEGELKEENGRKKYWERMGRKGYRDLKNGVYYRGGFLNLIWREKVWERRLY